MILQNTLYDDEGKGEEKGGYTSTPPRMRSAKVKSQFHGLEDQPSPSGNLKDRIQRIRLGCIEGLGPKVFNEAYAIIKSANEGDDDEKASESDLDSTMDLDARLLSVLGKDKLRYKERIEELVFIEYTLG